MGEEQLLKRLHIMHDVKSQFPPLQTQEIEVVTLVLEEQSMPPDLIEIVNRVCVDNRIITIPALKPFSFAIATIERNSSRRGWAISRRKTGESQYYAELLEGGIQLEMVAIPAGTFLMGSPEDEPQRLKREGPQHEVSVSSFFMGKYPVTQAQWKAVFALPQVSRELDPDPSAFKGTNHPVETVSWYDAVEFCDRLSAHTGRKYRLPSEAEWEYACRAGTTTPFHFGETISSKLANYDGNYTYNYEPKGESRGETTPVD